MLETLTGTGLAASAGLNAYIPLLTMGLLSRYTTLVHLPDNWRWLDNGWVLVILAALLAVEIVADKIPVVDHLNDALQTAVRPTSGGLVFGASATSQTAAVTDPARFLSSHQWLPVVAGITIALVVHATKATLRAAINAFTAGLGAPVVSTVEDVLSVSMSLIAILLPVFVLVFLVGMAALCWWALRWRRVRRQRQPAALHPG